MNYSAVQSSTIPNSKVAYLDGLCDGDPLPVHCEEGGILGGTLYCAVCSLQCAVCSVQCALCTVQCAVCNVRCAVCSVQ